ncbi:MAG: flagellar basal body L-ring protein FlgH [Phycisphaeraceae bacterium]|nr:flagellar basal body L-ring protein FlgH [Phycisphaerae bacterium]MBX3392173.1 flagellar basal body L-ring protein FlgH [Phycisphaeraceae bacterium]HRJ51059.1 flagellar basal body L-ring protein FlgH [Phycisphaerales bacterium]
MIVPHRIGLAKRQAFPLVLSFRAMVWLGGLVVLAGFAPAAAGQSLFRRSGEMPVAPDGNPDPNAHLRAASLTYSEPPPPRIVQINDLVTIIIDETSKQKSEQTLDTKKNYDFEAVLEKFPSLRKLIDGELATGNSEPVVEMGIGSKNKFKGEGTFERTDRFSARIQAKVIDVKPNGVLVLEARKVVETGEEKQTIILSGSCRKEDVTNANTVLSTQLAELAISTQQEGEVRNSATKGLIPRLFEAIFNF